MKTFLIVLIFLLCPLVCQSKTTRDIILDYHYLEERVKKLKNYTEEDVTWLARNIYFEARSEELHGKMVIAFVTLNRVLDRRWRDTIKGVVTQRWQFSWYNKRKVPPINNPAAYDDAVMIAKMCIELYNSMAESEGWKYDGITKGANHYFADYIKVPSWASSMEYLGKVGPHLLYKG